MGFNLQEEILKYLEKHEAIDTIHLALHFKTDHQKIIGAVNSIQALGELILTEPVSHKSWELTEEGIAVAENGSHEARTYNAVSSEGLPLKNLKTVLPDKNLHSIGFSKAVANGWIYVDKSRELPTVRKKVPAIEDIVKEHLNLIRNQMAHEVDENLKQEYKKRKLLVEVVVKSYILRKGKEFCVSVSKPETDLTPEMITNGSWKDKSFKPYNFDALGTPLECGHLHTLLKVRAEFRRIFLEMGFTEMPTNNYIESSFWNFDSLFQPQQHPARDAHDTFFISEPQYSTTFPADYLGRVKQVHSKGGFGSQGYGYEWKIEEAQKNLLRTHTTAVSARMLYHLAQKGFQPVKYFSIDRVFRNETLDATHLAEFHQVEGVVADYKLTLGDLIGILAEFFKKLGMAKLQFKPAYNPYTEPSMEIFSYHEGLGKWMEVGNSGIFRPEMLRPMGLPEDVNVIAWGLSLERPTMIKYAINNIRDLVGPKVNLQMVHDTPICRLGKEKSKTELFIKDVIERWDSIHAKLQKLKEQVKALNLDNGIENRFSPVSSKKVYQDRNDVDLRLEVICSPTRPLYSALLLIKQIQIVFAIKLTTETNGLIIPSEIQLLSQSAVPNNLKKEIDIKFIWKDVLQPSLFVVGKEIVGEINILRYFNRLLETKLRPLVIYESQGVLQACQIDNWLDNLYSYSNQNNFDSLVENINKHLSHNHWLVGKAVTAADIYLWSLMKQNLSYFNQLTSVHLNNFFCRCNDFFNVRHVNNG